MPVLGPLIWFLGAVMALESLMLFPGALMAMPPTYQLVPLQARVQCTSKVGWVGERTLLHCQRHTKQQQEAGPPLRRRDLGQ